MKKDFFKDNLKYYLGVLIPAILGIALSIMFFMSPFMNLPVSRSEAIAYTGEFAKYEIEEDYRAIHFRDGACHEVYPHTEPEELREAFSYLAPGTVIHILVNPNNNIVAEIRTDSEELLNFEESQKDVYNYQFGFWIVGALMLIAALLLLLYPVIASKASDKEIKRQQERAKRQIKGEDDRAIRRADSGKSRILLAAKVEEYDIVYRRRKAVNELVINGWVYDEIKGILEFEHSLTASLGGHHIEVGLDSDSYSYILFDGKRIAEKKRTL